MKLIGKSIIIPFKYFSLFYSNRYYSELFYTIKDSKVFIQKSYGEYTINIIIGCISLLYKSLLALQEYFAKKDKNFEALYDGVGRSYFYDNGLQLSI